MVIKRYIHRHISYILGCAVFTDFLDNGFANCISGNACAGGCYNNVVQGTLGLPVKPVGVRNARQNICIIGNLLAWVGRAGNITINFCRHTLKNITETDSASAGFNPWMQGNDSICATRLGGADAADKHKP